MKLPLCTNPKSVYNLTPISDAVICIVPQPYSLASSDLKEYTISNVLICKTDTGMKLYKINEYPDYEYIARYHAWDGEIYKKDETD